METFSNTIYDPDQRAFIFVKDGREYVNKLSKRITNVEIGRQLMRSAGSVGANYIEANESLRKKEFILRLKMSKLEVKKGKRNYDYVKKSINQFQDLTQ